MTVSPSPEQLSELVERFGATFLRFAVPGDEQDAPPWILRFADKDCGEQVFIGDDAEQRAWEAWNRYAPSYNCYLFQPAPIADALESTQAEIARLTTVSGDMVEEMARAICSKRIGPLEEGSWAILSERGKEAIREEAQAAATIAKGRIDTLTEAVQALRAELEHERSVRVEEARAALKDSPNE